MTAHGADSEVGRLETVLLHRPGNELKRLTPRNNDRLLFDGIPWVARAQDEHDAFAQALRDRGIEVLYLTDLLTETLAQDGAREHAIATALAGLHLGDTLRGYLARFLGEATPEELTGYLTAGIRNDEVRGGFGLVTSLLPSDDFLIDPLPNLLFTRDSSVWVRDRVGDHLAGDAGPRARDPADRADLHRAPAVPRHPPSCTGGSTSTSRAATCCSSRPA